jgi:hypothetical protein
MSHVDTVIDIARTDMPCVMIHLGSAVVRMNQANPTHNQTCAWSIAMRGDTGWQAGYDLAAWLELIAEEVREAAAGAKAAADSDHHAQALADAAEARDVAALTEPF